MFQGPLDGSTKHIYRGFRSPTRRDEILSSTLTSQRSYATGVRATLFGLVSFPVDLVPQARPNKADDTGFKMLAPPAAEGEAPAQVRQMYLSENGDLFEPHQTIRGREVDGQWVVASKEEIAAAKTGGLDKNQIDLSCHPVAEVADTCRPGKGGYRLRPDKKLPQAEVDLYATVREFVASVSDQFAFVGSLRLRDSRAVYRLETWGDQLVLAELVTASDLAERDMIGGDVNPTMVERLVELAGMSSEPFVEDVHRWDAAKAVAELVGEKEPIASVTEIDPPSSDNVMAMLEAAVAAKRAAA